MKFYRKIAEIFRRSQRLQQSADGKISKYIKALGDKDNYVRRNAAWALVDHYLEKKDENGITELLSHEVADVRWSATEAVKEAALNRQSITAAVPALANALGDEDEEMRKEASWVLWYAAKKEQGILLSDPLCEPLLNKWYAAQKEEDITLAVPALIKALKDGNADVRKNAAWALACHCLDKEDENGIAALLSSESADVRKYAAKALRHAASKRGDITFAVPALANALRDRNVEVRKYAAKALRCAAFWWHDITFAVPALTKALGDGNAEVRKEARKALESVVFRWNSIEKLNEMQAAIEKSFREWFDKNGYTIDPWKMALVAKMKYAVSQLLIKISKKKAELAKNMLGEILLGETVKRPRNGKEGIYRAGAAARVRC